MLSKTISKYLTLLWVTCFGFPKISNPRMATSTSLAIPCHSSELNKQQAKASRRSSRPAVEQQVKQSGVAMEKLRLLALLVLMIFSLSLEVWKGEKDGSLTVYITGRGFSWMEP